MNIQCFDLLFFYGNSPISTTIKLAQKAIKNELLNNDNIPSHVAVIISKKYLPTLKNVDNEDDYYLWESNVTIKNKIDKMADIVDIESGEGVAGVQIRPYKDVILESLSNGYAVGWCRLINNPINKLKYETDEGYNERMILLKKKICKFHELHYHQSYEISIFDCISTLIPCLHNCCSYSITNNKVICSEFAVLLYQTLGLLPIEITASDITPYILLNINHYGKYLDDPILDKPIMFK